MSYNFFDGAEISRDIVKKNRLPYKWYTQWYFCDRKAERKETGHLTHDTEDHDRKSYITSLH
jgi:hypothetical protein